ncbi:uncharacterized protein LOC120110467 [Phoenix dactylifera]|uniref:Uncharacterized protein LOC120110467 n=1 Tax=Phoenix dactylifera TaxID=42345 RepID=A0A8B9ABY9_PHODC|nr:uncharacterized protein LOC120110467 [Phoenix dactylifera]
MTSLQLPAGVIDRIDRKRRSSLWRRDSTCGGGHSLAEWDNICRQKRLRGLGVLNLRLMKHCVLTKWWWRFYTETERPWRKLINRLYFTHKTPSQASKTSIRKASPVWKSVVNTQSWFFASIFLSLGNGNQIAFWHDPWLTREPLKVVFPITFALTRKPDVSVASYLRQSDVWNSMSPTTNGRGREEHPLMRKTKLNGNGMLTESSQFEDVISFSYMVGFLPILQKSTGNSHNILLAKLPQQHFDGRESPKEKLDCTGYMPIVRNRRRTRQPPISKLQVCKFNLAEVQHEKFHVPFATYEQGKVDKEEKYRSKGKEGC